MGNLVSNKKEFFLKKSGSSSKYSHGKKRSWDYLKHRLLRSVFRAADFVIIHWPRKVNSSLNCVQPALHQLRYWLGKCLWLVLILTRHCVGCFMKHPISIADGEGWVSDLRGSRAGRRYWPERKPSASLSQWEVVTVALGFARTFFPTKSLSGISAHFYRSQT